MVTEHLTDAHRQLLIVFATQAWARIKDDFEFAEQADECETIIRMLSGTDTRVVVERAYPSKRPSSQEPPAFW